MDGVDVKLYKGMHCSSQSSHPTKRACAHLAAGNVLVLKEEDPTPVDISRPVPNGVSKLDPPAVKRPPARYVAFGNADLTSNATGGSDQEGQDVKEEEITRRDDRDKGDGITEEAKAGGLQNDDEVNGQEKNDNHSKTPRQKRTTKSFEERIEELEAFKEKHDHVRVTAKHDKSLATFCAHIRSGRRGTGAGTLITEDRIKALDELGFDWGRQIRTTKVKSFEERIEELKSFKAKHGHVRVAVTHDMNLATFCTKMRCARRTGLTITITEDRIKALDELGFEWGDIRR